MKSISFFLFFIILCSCDSAHDVHEDDFSSLDSDNIPSFLLKSTRLAHNDNNPSPSFVFNILDHIDYDTSSIYIFRPSFDFGDLACLRIQPVKKEHSNIEYYEFNVNRHFSINPSGEYVFANKQRTPSIKKWFFEHEMIATFDLEDLKVYSVKSDTPSIEGYNMITECFKYYIFLPKKKQFFELKNSDLSSIAETEQMIGKIMSKVSYKEELFYQIYTYQTKIVDDAILRYSKDREYFKKMDSSDYLIPSSEVELFFHGSIYDSIN